MRLILAVSLVGVFGMPAVFAQDFGRACLLNGPTYQLAADTVTWSMTIGEGQRCVRGVRSAYTILDGVKLLLRPKSGQVVLDGPGFIYQSPSNFRGQDSFSLSVTGKTNNNVSGNSTILVLVSVK
jgi:hypothetical protein